MKKRILSLLLVLCMAFALFPATALAAAGESDVDLTVERNAATATVTAGKLEVEEVSWSGDTVTIKVKVKDGNPFTVFAKNASDIYATVNKSEAKVERVDDKHIVVTYTFEAAKPTDPNTTVTLRSAHTKEELNKKWEQCRSMYTGGLFAKRPSVSAPYATGILADGAVTDAVNFLNFARYSVGLPDVKLDAELQDLAQYGSVLMAAANQMSHTNAKPADMPQDFYEKGYKSTTTSNICSLPMEERALISGLQLYLADETPTNVVQVGHRRWLLNPKLSKVGFGAATGKDGRTYHNVQCFDTSGPGVSYEAIAWPAPGYQALELYLDGSPFTASLNPAIYDSKRVDEIQAKVVVTDVDGRLHTTTLTKADKDTKGKFFNVITSDGVATGFTVIFRPSLFTAEAGMKVRAEISGLYKIGSATPVTLCWETEFFYPEYFNFTDMEFSDITSLIKNKMRDSATTLGNVADQTVTEADLVRVALYPVRDDSQVAFVGTHDFSRTAASGGLYAEISTVIDLTYHGRAFSVPVSCQIKAATPEGEKGKALEEIKAAIRAAGGPTLGSELKAIAQPIAEAHGLELASCGYRDLSADETPAYQGLRRYNVSFVKERVETPMGMGFTTEDYTIVYDGGGSLGLYLPLGSTQMPAVGALAATEKPAGEPEKGTETVAGTAYPSTQTVDLDGRKVEFQMYALKDANGNLTNYVKVRDLALALNGTKAQFNVDWNGVVNLVAGAAYKANGSENQTPFSGQRAYTVPTSPTNVNGSASDLQALTLTDDNGGGYTYYQLRDLGRKLGFNVDWSAEKGVFIETDKPYSGK